jgi:glycosyltransferase involved in cell wall biosynthesis
LHILVWSICGGEAEENSYGRGCERVDPKNDLDAMIHLFINALSASAGGGLTYIQNVVPQLALRDDVLTTLLVGDALLGKVVESERVKVISEMPHGNSALRFIHEQLHLRAMIRRSGANILLSPGNFALFRSPVPQILLSRNALYTSADFLRDLRARRDYRLWMDTLLKGALARRSISAADCTVAPSEAFASDLRRWTGKPVVCIHHGFDRGTFFRDSTPLPADVQTQLAEAAAAIKILFVSHYNYYRNFETLIRAIAIAKEKLHPRAVRLFLTCKLISIENPGSYQAENAAELVRHLQLEKEVVQLGSIPYPLLHHLYLSCDIYATSAYAETFAHPLVEAMASGLPVIASDLPVHREICREAAVYFPRFSPEMLAQRIVELSESETTRAQMREQSLLRSQDFRWDRHLESLLELAKRLAVRP